MPEFYVQSAQATIVAARRAEGEDSGMPLEPIVKPGLEHRFTVGAVQSAAVHYARAVLAVALALHDELPQAGAGAVYAIAVQVNFGVGVDAVALAQLGKSESVAIGRAPAQVGIAVDDALGADVDAVLLRIYLALLPGRSPIDGALAQSHLIAIGQGPHLAHARAQEIGIGAHLSKRLIKLEVSNLLPPSACTSA